MQIKKKNQNEAISDSQLVSYCPLCRVSFTPKEFVVIGESGQTHLLYVRCSHCTSSLVVLLLVHELCISSVGVVTDLTEDDVACFQNTDPLTADDCLGIHTEVRRELPGL
jgi:formate dehydrogenase maturation protein FdhE